MTKRELIAKIAEDTDLDLSPVEAVLNSLGNVAAAELLGGGDVPIPRLGKLKTKDRGARLGTNPKTGERMTIPAGTMVKFVTGKELKDALQG